MKQLTLYLFLLLVSCCQAQNQDASSFGKTSTNVAEQIKNADLCEILKSPQEFEGKSVKVKAVYRYGFEWSEIYTLKCQTNKRIWVETTDKKCQDSSKAEDLPFAGVESKTAGIIAEGKFTFKKEGYGYMNSFDYKFTVNCFEKVTIIDDEGFVPQALTPEQRRRIEEFENSK